MAHYRIKPGKIGNFLINTYYDIEYDVVSTYKKIEKAFAALPLHSVKWTTSQRNTTITNRRNLS